MHGTASGPRGIGPLLGLGGRPGDTGYRQGVGRVGHPRNRTCLGAGVAEGKPRPDFVRAQQFGLGDGPGRPGNRRTFGYSSRRPGQQAGLRRRVRQHKGRASQRRRAPSYRMFPSCAGLRYRGSGTGVVPQPGPDGRGREQAGGRGHLRPTVPGYVVIWNRGIPHLGAGHPAGGAQPLGRCDRRGRRRRGRPPSGRVAGRQAGRGGLPIRQSVGCPGLGGLPGQSARKASG